MKIGQSVATVGTVGNVPDDWPDAASLAALRACYEGMSSREAVEQFGAGPLRCGLAEVAAVAQEVGDDPEAVFARAFKRLVGQPPAAWRRAQAG